MKKSIETTLSKFACSTAAVLGHGARPQCPAAAMPTQPTPAAAPAATANHMWIWLSFSGYDAVPGEARGGRSGPRPAQPSH